MARKPQTRYIRPGHLRNIKFGEYSREEGYEYAGHVAQVARAIAEYRRRQYLVEPVGDLEAQLERTRLLRPAAVTEVLAHSAIIKGVITNAISQRTVSEVNEALRGMPGGLPLGKLVVAENPLDAPSLIRVAYATECTGIDDNFRLRFIDPRRRIITPGIPPDDNMAPLAEVSMLHLKPKAFERLGEYMLQPQDNR